jgi:hypothetical protein
MNTGPMSAIKPPKKVQGDLPGNTSSPHGMSHPQACVVQAMARLSAYNPSLRVDGPPSLVHRALFPSLCPVLVLVPVPVLALFPCPDPAGVSAHNSFLGHVHVHGPVPLEPAHLVLQEHSSLADADETHELEEAEGEGQRTKKDVGEVVHDHGHDPGPGRDGASCFPSDRVHARPQEEELDQDPMGGPWPDGPLFPSPSPFPCLYLSPSPCLDPCPYPSRARAP